MSWQEMDATGAKYDFHPFISLATDWDKVIFSPVAI